MIEIKPISEIDTSVIYTSIKELMNATGLGRSTIHWHLHKGTMNGFQIDGRGMSAVYFHPDEAEKVIGLVRAGIIRPKGKPATDSPA